MKYSLELMKNSLERFRPWGAVSIAYRMVRGKIAGQRRLVFALARTDLDRTEPQALPDYRIKCFSSLQAIESALSNEIFDKWRSFGWSQEHFEESGTNFWVGLFGNRLANLGVSRNGIAIGSYFFPLQPNWAVLSHFVTLSDFRGRHLYLIMLRHIVHTLADGGTDKFFIDCTDWNLASIRGIERAGFRRIGIGRVERKGKVAGFHPIFNFPKIK